MRYTKWMSAAIAAAGMGTAARAQDASCGFDSPAFVAGPLDGQGGWRATPEIGAASIVSQPRRGGNQAARFDMSAAAYDVFADWPCDVKLGAADSIIDVEWDFYYQFGDGYGWTVQLQASNGVPLAWLWIDGGNMWFRIGPREPMPVGVYLPDRSWGHFRASVDWRLGRTTLFVNGQEGATAPFYGAPARGVGLFSLASIMGGYTDICGLDGLSVRVQHACPADFNGDGFVDFFDADEFVACFEGVGCPSGSSADFNGDGFVDFLDIDAFVAAFEAGC